MAILNKARKLLEKISQTMMFDINEKKAIIYLFDVLSANMLDENEHEEYMEKNNMLINPTERYMKKEGIKEGKKDGIKKGKVDTARNMLKEGFSMDIVLKVTGLCEKDILNTEQSLSTE